jgi:hypothetical protein
MLASRATRVALNLFCLRPPQRAGCARRKVRAADARRGASLELCRSSAVRALGFADVNDSTLAKYSCAMVPAGWVFHLLVGFSTLCILAYLAGSQGRHS